MPLLDLQRRGQQIGRLRIGQQVQASNGKMRPVPARRLPVHDGEPATAAARSPSCTAARSASGTASSRSSPGSPRSASPSRPAMRSCRSGTRCGPRAAASGGVTPSTSRSATARACARTPPTRRRRSRSPRKALERAGLAKAEPAAGVRARHPDQRHDPRPARPRRVPPRHRLVLRGRGDRRQRRPDAGRAGPERVPPCHAADRVAAAGRGRQDQEVPGPGAGVLATFRASPRGALEAAGIAAQLPPAPGESAAPSRPAPRAGPARDRPAARQSRPPAAQDIADAAAKATAQAQIREMKAAAEEHRLAEDMICVPDADMYEQLDSYLHGRWEELAPEAAP